LEGATVRLVDVVLRSGHLSERALVEAAVSGDRPAHLDRCDLCAERALELSRWLTAVREAAVEAADQAFPPERLAAQQSQIMRRLELADEPSRIIAFPGQSPLAAPAGRRRVAPAWVGLAAAAGLVIGVVAGQATARLDVRQAPSSAASHAPVAAPATPAAQQAASDPLPAGSTIALLGTEEEFTPTVLQSIDAATPTLVARVR
jgi:pyruvate/2-oxoglutarate dehydrogenase complex dihydrolipoamide acyltransferase (E2) component